MPSPVLSLFDVLTAEYESQELKPPLPQEYFATQRESYGKELSGLCDPDSDDFRRKLDELLVKDFYTWLHDNGVRRSALCFSGGGIRSATFGLGIVQGLARAGLLRRFDFLSTVSGGGYLGSWLSSWIDRARQELKGEPRSAIAVVEEQLSKRPDSPLAPEPEPVRYLRRYSRYMSPKVGLLSADTWTLIAIFLRNLFLNWLVLLPLMAAVLMIPRVSVILVRLGTRPWFQAQEGWVLPATFWVSAVLGMIAIAYISLNRSGVEEHRAIPPHMRGQKYFLLLCLTPLYLMAVLISLFWAWRQSLPKPYSGVHFLGWQLHPLLSFALYGVLLHLGGFLMAWLWKLARLRMLPRHVAGELLVVAATGALGGAAGWLPASNLFSRVVDQPLSAELYVCFASPLLLFLFLVAATLFVGLSSYYTNDADREWLARAGAWVLIAIAVRSAFSAIVIFGPGALIQSAAWIQWMIGSIGGVSGLATLALGRSARTRVTPGATEDARSNQPPLVNLALALAAPLFAVFILILLSLGTTLLIQWLTGMGDVRLLMDVVYGSPWWGVAAVFILLAGVGFLMGWFVDINRFSLHAAYRDRLIRAYMGASRGSKRRPHPFTGFDEDDNLQLSELRGNRPLHIVNMALNLVGGSDLAWQDRKAETFTASPLHAGSFLRGYRDTQEYGLHRDGRNALSLGTAMAISGAAASPNMGYHSSPVVTFLLALFNVRLGWWLGNPGTAGEKSWNTPGPRFAPASLFAEAFGLTDDQHPYVYLSDGGHFENLALYEMILRRCHFIVVSDGGEDSGFTFEDLGNAVAKVRVDLGVPIRFEQILIRPRPKDLEIYDIRSAKEKGKEITQPYYALARIGYSCVDRRSDGTSDETMDGLLLYIKPSLNGTEPADVFHYARQHPAFPHEPTANQLYTEQQFESYRELGSHVMDMVCLGLPADASLADLFKKMEKELWRPAAG